MHIVLTSVHLEIHILAFFLENRVSIKEARDLKVFVYNTSQHHECWGRWFRAVYCLKDCSGNWADYTLILMNTIKCFDGP